MPEVKCRVIHSGTVSNVMLGCMQDRLNSSLCSALKRAPRLHDAPSMQGPARSRHARNTARMRTPPSRNEGGDGADGLCAGRHHPPSVVGEAEGPHLAGILQRHVQLLPPQTTAACPHHVIHRPRHIWRRVRVVWHMAVRAHQQPGAPWPPRPGPLPGAPRPPAAAPHPAPCPAAEGLLGAC